MKLEGSYERRLRRAGIVLSLLFLLLTAGILHLARRGDNPDSELTWPPSFLQNNDSSKDEPDTDTSGSFDWEDWNLFWADFAEASSNPPEAPDQALPEPTDQALPAPTDEELPSLTDEELPELSVHFIDVGQADCILIRTGSHAMLIDAGNNDDAERITDYLNTQGITGLDYVIGTHPHEDHIGSLDTVLFNFDVKKVILPEVAHTSSTFEDVLTALETKDLTVTAPVPGSTYSLGTAAFQILAPNADYGDNLNNWSVGIRLTHGDVAFVMIGDAEKAAEADILKQGYDLSANVYKAGHHGSETSNSRELLEAINPSAVVITCEKGNSYGHPHSSVLSLFKDLGITNIYRTDEQGTIIAVSDGRTVTFTP
ncbi:MAG: MBL fold metallo-hydrolase [Lachnospiraceae bacterium]|nr:MBL fold metallo-hydrolase [Lachnospiraceae bacterium]